MFSVFSGRVQQIAIKVISATVRKNEIKVNEF